jgi:antitoxin ParD1/3/4
MHVSLTPQLEELVKEKVASGLYNNASEVIRETLRLMHQQDAVYKLKLERLRELLIEGEQSGVSEKSIDDLIAEVEAELHA